MWYIKLHNKFNIIVNSAQSQLIYKNDKQTCKSNVFLLLNVNDYQPSSLQVVGDHSAIIMGPVLSIYLCNFFIKQQLVHDEREFIKHFEQRCRDMYIQDGFNDIQSSSRCRMYKEIKQVHKPEVYLTVNINNKVCTSFTKLRLSSHKLLLERGC